MKSRKIKQLEDIFVCVCEYKDEPFPLPYPCPYMAPTLPITGVGVSVGPTLFVARTRE